MISGALYIKRGNVKILRLAVIASLIIGFMMGCSGNYGKIHTQSESDAKATQKELLNNWMAYNVYVNRSPTWVVRLKGPSGAGAIVFDPKNDNRKILVGRNWDTIEDQKAWTEMLKANTTSAGDFNMSTAGSINISSTGVREIWGPDNQHYGFIISQIRVSVVVKKVDEKSIRLRWTPDN